MTTYAMGYQNADIHGVPSFESLDTFTQTQLVAGSEPSLMPAVRILLGDSLTLAQFTVVGLSSGKIVAATYNATLGSAVRPIGVLVHAATSGGSNTTIKGEVWLTGCFNADSDSPLVWDASFDTLAKKTTWEGVVGNPDLIFRSRIAA